jgi:hypothetical protein
MARTQRSSKDRAARRAAARTGSRSDAPPPPAPSARAARAARAARDDHDAPTPIGDLLWFGWAIGLLAVTGLLLPRIIGFVDFSEKAPFSLLGIFMMGELALVIFGVTVALQRKRIAHGFALAIALLPTPVLAGLPPTLLGMPPEAAAGWALLFVPIGIVISIVLVLLLLRPAARAYFTEP